MSRLADAGKGGASAPPDPWDPVVRLTHWTIVAAVIANQFLVKPGGVAHVWIGWGVLSVLALRLVWGLAGPPEARFTSFLPHPRAAMSHLMDLIRGRSREYPSHNPAGAIMVYALWASLLAATVTGLVMTGGVSPVVYAEQRAAVAAGDWSVLVKDGEDGQDSGEAGLDGIAKEVHEVTANLILILALIHVAGVVVESRQLGRNLVRPMLVRRRRP